MGAPFKGESGFLGFQQAELDQRSAHDRFFDAARIIATSGSTRVRDENRRTAIKAFMEILDSPADRSTFTETFHALIEEDRVAARTAYHALFEGWGRPASELRQVLGLPLTGMLFPRRAK